jgi:citrate lyase subunit beta/citryl-CoA lyase
MRPIRSLLFAPANRHDLLRKFPKYPADAVAMDLEDGTPDDQKAAARDGLPEIVTFLRHQGLKALLLVRVNGPRSPHLKDDIAAAKSLPIDGIVVPKVETAADLDPFNASLPTIAVVETARGVANVEASVQQQGGHLAAVAFGAEDFVTDIGGLRTPDGVEVLYARSRVVLAARVAGLQALDLVFTNIRDDDAFRRDAELGRQLGYSGKMCITPRQVEIVNATFSPSAEDIDRSRRLVAAWEAAQGEGRGVIEFEGSMVDEPLLKRARTVLQLAGELFDEGH